MKPNSKKNNLFKNLSTSILWIVKKVSINESFVFLASLLDYLHSIFEYKCIDFKTSAEKTTLEQLC